MDEPISSSMSFAADALCRHAHLARDYGETTPLFAR
jgi:hypothetical protein